MSDRRTGPRGLISDRCRSPRTHLPGALQCYVEKFSRILSNGPLGVLLVEQTFEGFKASLDVKLLNTWSARGIYVRSSTSRVQNRLSLPIPPRNPILSVQWDFVTRRSAYYWGSALEQSARAEQLGGRS